MDDLLIYELQLWNKENNQWESILLSFSTKAIHERSKLLINPFRILVYKYELVNTINF